uniref:Uncharacterized protein n=1 Tax=Arundo donax TaxID=35708 RepID=A0A0A8YW90_ARUDO
MHLHECSRFIGVIRTSGSRRDLGSSGQ